MALMGVRKLMDYFYTQKDLSWLDHLLPEDDMRKQEDKGNMLERGVPLIAPQKRPVAVLSCHTFHFVYDSSSLFYIVFITCSASTVSVISFA